MKKFAVIGNIKSDFFNRLKEKDLNSYGIELFSLSDIRVEIGDYTAAFAKNEDLSRFSKIYFYAVDSRLPIIADMASILDKCSVQVLDYSLQKGVVRMDKFYLKQNESLHYPPSVFYFRFKHDDLSELQYPCILKTLHGSKGNQVALARNETDVINFLSKFGHEIVVQRLLDIQYDIRAIVIDGNYIGAFKRYRKEGDFLTTRPGGLREPTDLDSDIISLVEQTVRNEGLFFAGVDLAVSSGRYYCFEINGSPQIRVFQKVTGIDIIQEFINALTADNKLAFC
jgi:glutathione synthase/RimK-type ligase-like ATP-grasp enzyme